MWALIIVFILLWAWFSRASSSQNGRFLCGQSLNISGPRRDSPTIAEALQGIQELVQFCLSANGPRKSCQVQDIIQKIHSNLTKAKEVYEKYVQGYEQQICSMVNEIGRLEAQVQEQKTNRDTKQKQLKKKRKELEMLRESREKIQRSINGIKGEIKTQEEHADGLAKLTIFTLAIPIVGLASSIVTGSMALHHKNKAEELNAVLEGVERNLQKVTAQEKDVKDQLKSINDQINDTKEKLRKMNGALEQMKQNRNKILQFGESIKKIHTMVSTLQGKSEVLHRSNRDHVSMNVLLPLLKDIVDTLITRGNHFEAILDTSSYNKYYGFFNSHVRSITAKINQLTIENDQF